eukprot:jgi/Ulvmu1/3263/UM151_0011.1
MGPPGGHKGVDSAQVDPLSASNLSELERNVVNSDMSRMVLDYYANGSDGQVTLQDNQAAFHRYKLLPRMLRDVSNVQPRTTVLGCDMEAPVMVCPMAMQQMAHPDGERAMARACKAAGCVMVVSTMANCSIETIAEAAGTEHLWFQLYVFKSRSAVESLVTTAERLGYRALVVTVDAPFIGNRESDHTNRFQMPEGLSLGNSGHVSGGIPALGDGTHAHEQPAEGTSATATATEAAAHTGGSALAAAFTSSIDASLTWDFLDWLRTVTSLPILVKGILHPEDARLAVQHGAAGIIVSNHGGRQLDHAAAPLDVISAVQFSAQLEATRHVRFAPGWFLAGLRSMRSVPALAAVVVSSGWRAHDLPFADLRSKAIEMFLPIQGVNIATVMAAAYAGMLYYGSMGAERWLRGVQRKRRTRAMAARPVPVLLDGGVRRGTDVVKALALGADAVGVGRPLLYALAEGGEEGVRKALECVKRETRLSMALAGAADVGTLQQGGLVVHTRDLPLSCVW